LSIYAHSFKGTPTVIDGEAEHFLLPWIATLIFARIVNFCK
jgi:hypothetical protein